MTFMGHLVALTKEDIVEYCKSTYNHYFNYDIARDTLRFYPMGSMMLIRGIISIYNQVEFKKIFTFLNLCKFIDYLLGIIINRLKMLRNYDILDGVDLVVFFFEFLIDKYIFRLNGFQMAQKCRFSLRYYALWIRCFSTIEIKKDVHPFFYGALALVMTLLVVPPLFYAIITDIENFNTFDNLYHYFISTVTPF
ncbi:phosphoserine aminotransferase (apicoplast) [Babesia ovis]|uniref:Phosphoserine aminotransferase n=1 Tax=Babesia ovis TaxID=5869 RepID=A0A9W5TFA9_BABOV|nr:phosphoserine aminotransferase [Babesia ovis]GFE55948.1 phosphoserine aminotransferase [Babesia ovis]